jgi:hypothetical protein
VPAVGVEAALLLGGTMGDEETASYWRLLRRRPALIRYVRQATPAMWLNLAGSGRFRRIRLAPILASNSKIQDKTRQDSTPEQPRELPENTDSAICEQTLKDYKAR